MSQTLARPGRVSLAPGLEISRIVTGLWQVADLERAGPLDPDEAARALAAYAAAGFDTFDMADHYGSAELIAGPLPRRRRRRRVPAAGGRAAGGVHQMVPGARRDERRTWSAPGSSAAGSASP